MRFNEYQKTKGPVLTVLIPFIDMIERVDLRILTFIANKE